MHWAQFRTSIAGCVCVGGLDTAVALCSLLPVVSSGYNTERETLGCPASGKVAQGKRESLTLPSPPTPSTQHLLPRSGCGKCFEQAPKREERVGSGFSFLSLPAFAASLCRPRPALLPGSQPVPNPVCPVHLSMACPGLGLAPLPLPFLPTLDGSSLPFP